VLGQFEFRPMRRLRLLIVAPLAIAFVVAFPFRVWWRARRDRTSVADTLKAMAADAYDEMSLEMRAEIDAERDKSN
jgi:hypothetical protein